MSKHKKKCDCPCRKVIYVAGNVLAILLIVGGGFTCLATAYLVALVPLGFLATIGLVGAASFGAGAALIDHLE